MIPFLANPQETLGKIGGEHAVGHFAYAYHDRRLQVTRHRYRVRGKVVRDVPSPLPREAARRIVAGLLAAYRRAQKDAQTAPPAYQAGANWNDVLARSRGALYETARDGDVERLTDLLGNFCRNALSCSILGGEAAFRSFAAHPVQESWVQHNLDVWMALIDGQAALEDAALPPIGNPYGYDVEGCLIDWNAFVNHGRAHRCLHFLEDEAHPVIAEIGGGFGGFAYHLLRRNRPLTYIDFDLPENLLIASYYLAMAFPEKRILLYDTPAMSLDPSSLRHYDAVLLPNFMLPALGDGSVSCGVNTISFSEMDYETIDEYFSQIDRIVSRYFYHENLSCHPEYQGFPSAVFPALPHFRQVFASFSPWQGLDAYALGHSYLERLFLRRQ